MLRNKTRISLSRYPVIPLSRLNRQTGKQANRQTILVLCFLCLYSILFAEEGFIYDAKGKRNPFIPLVTSDGRLLKLESQDNVTGLFLEGIIYDKDGQSYVIINDEILKIGDKIGDYQVLKIEDKKIALIKDGELLEMVIEKEEW